MEWKIKGKREKRDRKKVEGRRQENNVFCYMFAFLFD